MLEFLKKTKSVEAKEVTLSPIEGVKITVYIEALNHFKNSLIGKVIKEGDLIEPDKKPRKSKGQFEEIFENFAGFFSSITFFVNSTEPKGEVKITENTIINVNHEAIDNNGMPKSKVVYIKSLPDTSNLIELRSIEDLKKLIETYSFVNCYEDKTQLIFIVDEYFYKTKKQNENKNTRS
ncbi:MAG TPA: hypothetical protein VJB94_01605 [Candidatus Nanoarchaeia archaeon]|nr:hypothetical protein [Candidatus Nanoarchaeia archaeon]